MQSTKTQLMRMENDDHWIKLVDIRKRKDCKAYDRAIEALLQCCEKEEEFIGYCKRGKVHSLVDQTIQMAI